MQIWFFGDSWPAGCELNCTPFGTKDDTINAFPGIVGRSLDISVQNKGVSGTSLESMIEEFLDADIGSDDIVIFCCTAKTRRLYRSETGKLNVIQFQFDPIHVNPYEDERIASHCCALLYHLTKSRNAIPYFLNSFDCVKHIDKMYFEIPEHSWLIPKTESILSYLFDPEFFHQWDHHHNGNFQDWLQTESELVKKYIRPNNAHPNQVGHNTIANFIIDQLKIRGHVN